MWQELVDQKEKWIGRKLIDQGFPGQFRYPEGECPYPISTKIIDLLLSGRVFYVIGQDFDCTGAIADLEANPESVENRLAIFGYGGHRFDIVRPD